jgi:hypothetical protein
VGESVSNGTPWDTRRPPRGNFSLTKYGVSRGTKMERTNVNLKDIESSTSADSDKGSCTEALQVGATGQDPAEQGAGETSLIGGEHPSPSNLSLENLEGLREVSTLSLQVTSKNHCGAAKKRARGGRLVEAPSGDSGSGQPRSAPGGQPQTLQKPSSSRVQQGKPTDSKGLPPGPSKRQRSARCTPGGASYETQMGWAT